MENERQEALENIELIKDMVLQTKKQMSLSGAGWIAIIWGIYCWIGIAGSWMFIPHGIFEGVWWTGLGFIGLLATFLVVKYKIKPQPERSKTKYMRWFFLFWIPLLILAYTLALLCVFLPGLSHQYITIFILLVVSTGYMMIGFMMFKEMLFMGILGMAATILTAFFFLEYNGIILSVLFGVGLIITGIVINHKWRE